MKIGITSACVELVRRSGVKVLGLQWYDALASLGHDVELINYWDDVDCSKYDAVILLRMGALMRGAVNDLKNYNIPVISAPIFAPRMSKRLYRLAAKYGHIDRLHMTNPSYEFHEAAKKCSMFIALSEFEKEYLVDAYDVPADKIRVVYIPFRITPADTMPTDKEPFCFHVSNLNAPNKNVARLIEAAKKYKFRLVLGGSVKGDDGRRWLNDQMAGSENISYIGQLTDDELRSWYLRAKVFALPSLSEGVGMVALEAAACGAEIVITNYGAPKEYYNGLARLVDPKSVDDIGQAVIECMERKSTGELMNHIKTNYSPEHCAKVLESAVSECVRDSQQR